MREERAARNSLERDDVYSSADCAFEIWAAMGAVGFEGVRSSVYLTIAESESSRLAMITCSGCVFKIQLKSCGLLWFYKCHSM